MEHMGFTAGAPMNIPDGHRTLGSVPLISTWHLSCRGPFPVSVQPLCFLVKCNTFCKWSFCFVEEICFCFFYWHCSVLYYMAEYQHSRIWWSQSEYLVIDDVHRCIITVLFVPTFTLKGQLKAHIPSLLISALLELGLFADIHSNLQHHLLLPWHYIMRENWSMLSSL